MAISPELVGRTYPAIEPYTVSREAVRAFAAAVFAQDPAHTDPEAARALGHADLLAPPTVASSVAPRAEAAVVADPELVEAQRPERSLGGLDDRAEGGGHTVLREELLRLVLHQVHDRQSFVLVGYGPRSSPAP